MEKDTIIGWMAFEKNCTMVFTFAGKLIIRPIFSKRKEYKKSFPNCKPTKVQVTIKTETRRRLSNAKGKCE